jgi:hypothetical protein
LLEFIWHSEMLFNTFPGDFAEWDGSAAFFGVEGASPNSDFR